LVITYIKTMKKHSTMPNEPEEFPLTREKPEITQPHDPKEPEFPQEDPQQEPEEMPPGETGMPEVPGG
jgi:hypothetical protein